MATMHGNSASAGLCLLAVAALPCLADAREILSIDFEDRPLGSPGIVRTWGSGNHWAYVTNVKPHGGEKSVVWASGVEAGEQATSFDLLPKETPGRDEVLKGDYLRVRYWYWPDTDTTGFWRVLDPEEGSGLSETAIAGEYNGGTLLFEFVNHLSGDDETDMAVSGALSSIIDSITYEK